IRPRLLFPRAPRPRRHARGAGGADRRAAVLRRRGDVAELFLDRAWGEGQWGKGGEGGGRAERQTTVKQRVYVGAPVHRFFADAGFATAVLSARSSTGPKIFSPEAESASQCPSLPAAGSTWNSTLPPPARKALAICRDNSGVK